VGALNRGGRLFQILWARGAIRLLLLLDV